MRKCNQVFNGKRGGFAIQDGKTVRLAHIVHKVVHDKGLRVQYSYTLTGLISLIEAFKLPFNVVRDALKSGIVVLTRGYYFRKVFA